MLAMFKAGFDAFDGVIEFFFFFFIIFYFDFEEFDFILEVLIFVF